MITFLFWNLRNKPLDGRIARIAVSYGVNIFVLAECGISPSVMLDSVNQHAGREFHFSPGQYEKIAIYTSFPGKFLSPCFESHKLTVRKLSLPGMVEILLAATHFTSKLHQRDDSQFAECLELARDIRRAEGESGHARTVLVGDLNMNPFESGIVAASGLHGTMARAVAQRITRKVQGRDYPFFYNPMWGLLGDGSEGPAGTYYYSKSEQVTYFWNTFDQVLIRPSLLPSFRNEDLKILIDDGVEPLLSTRRLPDNALASDHLPILFKLHL